MLARIEGKLDVLREEAAALNGGQARGGEVRVSESEAERVFLLMQRLEGGRKERKAPLLTVFRLLVLEGRSQAEAARLCGCVPPLLSRRVKTIESRFQMQIEQLRNFAPVIVEREASVKGDRVRKRKHGAARDEEADYDDGPVRLDAGEDDNGYLPEERPESE